MLKIQSTCSNSSQTTQRGAPLFHYVPLFVCICSGFLLCDTHAINRIAAELHAQEQSKGKPTSALLKHDSAYKYCNGCGCERHRRPLWRYHIEGRRSLGAVSLLWDLSYWSIFLIVGENHQPSPEPSSNPRGSRRSAAQAPLSTW